MQESILQTQTLDLSHIPFVNDDEQCEIEILLQNLECHIYDDEALADM